MLEWNLSALFEDEAELEKLTQESTQGALNFRREYEGRLAELAREEFLAALKAYEGLHLDLAQILSYASLCFARDTSMGGFYAKYEEKCKKIEENLLFFELEFCALSTEKSAELSHFCEDYRFYLQRLLERKKYQLTQKEERVLLHLSSTGGAAFSRLFDESLSAMKIPFEGKKLGEEEILSKLYHPERRVRKKAAKNFGKALRKRAGLLSFILNMIKSEKKSIALLRGYENAEISRHLSNQISQSSVDALIESTRANFCIVEDFYKIKKQILGFETLRDYDRYAPLGREARFSFEESKGIILEAFGDFCPEFESIAKEAFEGGWIDVYPRDKKQGGAFSHAASPRAHPYILLNHTYQRRDLFTLAHELGHAIHQKLSYSVSFLNQDTPLTTAETASVFAEMLVFDHIKKRLKGEELLALYAAKLEDIFATLFRQISFTCFERRIHAKEDELSYEELCKIWMEESAAMFGESLKLSKNYASWWSYIPHFVHSPFYCYAYGYAQLLVLALYGLYRGGECGNFKALYLKMLSLGGSLSPKELVGSFGFDIEDVNFWHIGMGEIKKLLEEFRLKAGGKAC